MAGQKTNESSEAYLDSLLQSMISSDAERRAESKATGGKSRLIFSEEEDEEKTDVEKAIAEEDETLEQTAIPQQTEKEERNPAEETEEFFSEIETPGLSEQTETDSTKLEAEIAETEAVESELSEYIETDTAGMKAEITETEGIEQELAEYIEDVQIPKIETIESEAALETENSVLETVETPENIEDIQQSEIETPEPPKYLEDLPVPEIEIPESEQETQEVPDGLEDFFEKDLEDSEEDFEDNEYEEYEEWEDDVADMKDDLDLFEMPDASELDLVGDTDISDEFHMDEQGILDEIESELSGIIPEKKEKREKRRKKEKTGMPLESGDTAFGKKETEPAGTVLDTESFENVIPELEQAAFDDFRDLEMEGFHLDEPETENAEETASSSQEIPAMEETIEENPELDISGMDLFGDESTSAENPGEDVMPENLEALFEEEKKEIEEGGKAEMDENDGFDLDSLFAASDDGFGEETPEAGDGPDGGDMDDLLGMLDMEDGESMQADAPDIFDMDQEGTEDIFSLDDGGTGDDIFSLDGMDMEEPGEEESKTPDPDNVFAESLAAVGFEEGNEEAPEEDAASEDGKKENKEKKKKKEKAKEEKGLFARLFGNVIDKKSKQQFEAEQKAEAEAEFKRSEKKRIKEGRLTDEEKAAAEAKEAEEAKLKEEKAAAKEAKKKAAEEKKAEKEAKKKAKKEALEAEAAKEVDEGRINRVGAGIVFAFFGAVAAGIVVGTNLYTYSQSISRATEYFDVQKYNNAYKEVYGLTIKEKDETIYNKIMTVMFVNKELNSYNNFYAIGLYPEALDSLLKGLERYDKYLQDAESLGIESDLNYVRRQILGELERSFSMTEKDAEKLNAMEDQAEYSECVRQKALAQSR